MRFQQLKSNPNSIMRKKLVKSKKNWIVVSSLAFAGGIFLLGGPSYVAKAATTTDVATVQTATDNKGQASSSSDGIKASSETTKQTAPVSNKTDTTTSQTAPVSNKTDTTNSQTVTADPATESVTPDSTKQDTATASTSDSTSTQAPKTTSTDPAAKTVTPLAAKSAIQPVAEASTATDTQYASGQNDAGLGWNISKSADATKDGTLNIGAGVFDESKDSADSTTSSAPWSQNSNDIKHISFNYPVVAAGNMSHYFSNLPNLQDVSGLDNIDFTSTTDMSGLFENDPSLKSIDLSTVKKTSNVTTMQDMFKNDTSLTSATVADANNVLDVSNVSNMQGIFQNNTSLTSIDFSQLITSSVTSMKSAFQGDTSLTSADFNSHKEMTKVENYEDMFNGDMKLSTVNTAGWQMSSSYHFARMFKNCIALQSLDLGSWLMPYGANAAKVDTGDSTKGDGMFDGTNLSSIRLSHSTGFSTYTYLPSSTANSWISGSTTFAANAAGLGTTYSSTNSSSNPGSGAPAMTYTPNTASDPISDKEITVTVTIPNNLGKDLTASVTGKVGSTQTVNIPTVDGYTASQSSVSVVIAPTGMTTDTITYTLNNTPWNYTVTLPDGTTQKVSGTTNKEGTPSKVGDKVTVTAPAVKGYNTPSASGTVQSDGSVKLDSGQSLNYVGNPVDNLSSKVSSNLGDQTVNNISGKVGDKITVDTPTVDGYTPDKKQITFTITPDGTATTTDTITYTGIRKDWNYNVTLPDGTIQKVSGTTNSEGTPSKVGDKVTVTAPAVKGYDTPSASGTVQSDGSVKLDSGQSLTYTGVKTDWNYNVTLPDGTTQKVTGSTNSEGTPSKVGDKVTVTAPAVKGYDTPSASGTIQSDGSVKLDSGQSLNYVGNPVDNLSSKVSSNLGDQTVNNISGKVGDKITVDTPTVDGYTPDKKQITFTITPDGTATTTDTITYTGIRKDWNYPVTLPDGTTQNVTGTTNNEGTPSKVGDKVTITAPAVNGYKTPSFTGTVQTDGSVKLDPNQNTNYVGNPVDNGTATIKTPDGDKTVDGIKGNVGDTVNVTLPDVDGYNHPTTAPGVIGPDGKVTVDPKDATYTGKAVDNSTATIKTPDGDKTVDGIKGNVGDTVNVTLPDVDGYNHPTTAPGVIGPNGKVTVDPKDATYTGKSVDNGTATIKTPVGDKTVDGIKGNVGDTVNVTLPDVDGYTHPTTAPGVIGPNGKVTVDPKDATYTGKSVDNGTATIKTPVGDKTVDGIKGNVGDTVNVTLPDVDGYNHPTTAPGVIGPDGKVTVDPKDATYTGKSVDNGTATIKTPNGDKTVDGIKGNVGDTVNVKLPDVDGYTHPTTAPGVIGPDGKVTVDPKDATYTGKSVDNGTATIKTPDGDKTVNGIKGNVGDTVNVTLPDADGYTHPTTAPGVIGPDGKVTVDPKDATYTGNTVKNGTATIPVTKDGQASTLPVTGINGTVGQTITIDVPNVPGYTSNKKTIQAVINSDHSISTTDKIVLTRIPSGTGSGTTTDPNVAGSNPDNANGSAVAIQMDVATYKDQPEVQVYTFSSDNKASEYSRKLGKDTAWYVDQKVSIDGILYYRVATNEYVKASDVYPYEDANLTIETRDRTSKTLYSAEGNVVTNRSLSAISDWFTDRTITINGEKYYRVASNEFVKASDVNPYQAIHSYVRVNGSTGSTQLYDTQGNAVTNRKVTAQSAWYTDQLVNINGTLYYRIATDEFIKADDVTVY